jgi:hypothetical protein
MNIELNDIQVAVFEKNAKKLVKMVSEALEREEGLALSINLVRKDLPTLNGVALVDNRFLSTLIGAIESNKLGIFNAVGMKEHKKVSEVAAETEAAAAATDEKED